jgi:hypothetical protein
MILANENAISSGGYVINNSLRFQSASSQYLSRTPASASNRTTWTYSVWVKRGALGVQHAMFTAGIGTPTFTVCALQFTSSDTIAFETALAGTTNGRRTTTQVFRDPSAWYHIVAVFDTTNATASNRMRLYVNGSQVTAFSATIDPTLNLTSEVNNTSAHYLGAYPPANIYLFDGYMAEVNFIDGQALTPSSFGETDPTSGQWVAKKYTGTYGTNGFYLPFSNGTSTTTLGADSSGNSNNWTLTNFTRSASVSDCWMYDVPSGNGYAGTQPSSNYAVLNPLDRKAVQNTFSEANLRVTTGTTEQGPVYATMMLPQGKWYAEFYITNATNAEPMLGVANMENSNENCYISNFFPSTGRITVNNTIIQTGFTGPVTGNTVSVLADVTAGSYTFWINGTQVGTAQSATINNPSFVMFDGRTTFGTTYQVNFGQRSFAFSPPTGYKALCTSNLP